VQEQALETKEMSDKEVGVCHGGSTYYSEAFIATLRWCDDNLRTQLRVVSVNLHGKALKGINILARL